MILLTLPSLARSDEVSVLTTAKNSCPFTKSSDSMMQLKEQLGKFSFQLLQQGNPTKDGICQSYMNTLNAARVAYSNVLRSQKLSSSADNNNANNSNNQADLDAQIQMSNALGGMLNANCLVDDEAAISSTALNLMNSISNTITVAGLIAPQALLIGVGLSALSQLGAALANALMSHDGPKDRLGNLLQNDAFLERLCIFRQLAYNVDAVDMDSIDAKKQKAIMEKQLNELQSKLYDSGGIQCFLTKESSQVGYEQLAGELKEIVSANDKKAASQKCATYTYAVEEKSRVTGRERGSQLFDLAWRIGCEDIGFMDLPQEESAPLDNEGSEETEEAEESADPGTISKPETSTIIQSRRVKDFCNQWRKLMDQLKAVDCFSSNTADIESFNNTAEFIFTNAASAGESSLQDSKDNNPDLYSEYRKLKDQQDFLVKQIKLLKDINQDQSSTVVQAQGMLTGLGDLLLGKGLKQYAEWNKKEILRNLKSTEEKLENAESGTRRERCAAGQFATQRLRQIAPRTQSLQKVCTSLGAHGTGPQPPFKDPSRTFDSIVDLEESPLDEVCTEEFLKAPREYETLMKTNAAFMKDCD
jgi:hypothetical protein